MDELDAALAALGRGEPIIFPTDTVYGIAAQPTIRSAVEAIFAAKGRPEGKPLPVLGATVDDLARVVALDRRARRLADRYWPGPLTLVLRRAPGFTAWLGDDGDSVAVRVPASERALELLARAGPLAVTSANRTGEPPAATVEEARAALGDAVAVFVDGGRLSGTASTVVSLLETPRVLREGLLPSAEVLSETRI